MSRRWRPDREGGRWEALRLVIFERDGYRCRNRKCGKAGRLECDHIKPLNEGGAPWDPANLQTLCRGCHIAKHRKPLTRERQRWLTYLAQRA